MLKFNVTVDRSGLDAKLAKVRNQLRFATALALTRTAKVAQGALEEATGRSFKSVTNFTRKAFFVNKATKQTLLATVGVKQKQLKWLRPEILGGARESGIERFFNLPGVWLVPTDHAKRTQNGKVSVAWLRKIAAALQSAPPIAGKTRRRNPIGQVFAVMPGSGKLPPGIYSTIGSKTVMLLQIVKQPKYSAKFDFYGIATRAAREAFPREFKAALREALASAR